MEGPAVDPPGYVVVGAWENAKLGHVDGTIIRGDWAEELDQQKGAGAYGLHVGPERVEIVDRRAAATLWTGLVVQLQAHVHEDCVAPEEVDHERADKDPDVVSGGEVPA